MAMGQPALARSSDKVNEIQETTEFKRNAGVSFSRYFTARLEAGKTPYDEIQ